MERYDCGSDVDHMFSNEFRKYFREENLLCLRWRYIYSYRTLFWVFEKENERDGVTSEIHIAYRRLANTIMLLLKTDYSLPGKSLVQFWRAEEVVVNSVDDGIGSENRHRVLLTTRDQPFLLWDHSLMYDNKKVSEGICSYRMRTCDVIITRDGGGGGGAIGRVFRNNKMEFTPDISYYSNIEYPNRDMALSFLIKGSLVLPFSDSSGSLVGVIEIVSQSEQLLYFMDKLLSILPGSDCGKGLCGQYEIERNSLLSTMSEIKKVMEVVCESFNLVFAQTWMLCKVCNSLSTSKRCAEELSATFGGYSFDEKNPFLEVGCYCFLRKGEGIVGKAAISSHNLVYCENVSKLSISEYPLAHFARKYYLSSCFAICLRSNHTGDRIYVLEFFLSSSYGEVRDLKKMLVPILEIMRQQFQTFKVAYGGEEIGNILSVQVLDASSPDKVETLEKGSVDLTGAAVPAAYVKAFNGGRGESSKPYYLQQSIGKSTSTSETDDSMIGPESPFRDFSMEETAVSSPSTVQSEFHVTIKGNYGDGFIWIQLYLSSGIDDLKQQVSQRLKLADGTYNLSYLDDDNDSILLTCDEDMQDFISSSLEQENFSSMVFIEPN